MKFRYIRLILLVTVFLLLSQGTQGSYVYEDTLVLLRSQYYDADIDDPVVLDGVLDDKVWEKAKSFPIVFEDPEDVTLEFFYANNQDNLYFAVTVTDLELHDNDSLLLTFDTDGNGELTKPEEGRLITQSSTLDMYWDGTSWVPDGLNPALSDGDIAEDRSGGSHTFEFLIPLVGDQVTYDGFRVVDLSNTIVGLNLQYNDTVNVTSSIEPVTFNFPTIPSNASGYIDLKIAGPEDQDLPEFTPPSTVTTGTNTGGSPPVDDAFDTIAGEAAALSLLPMAGILALTAIVAIRRRKS